MRYIVYDCTDCYKRKMSTRIDKREQAIQSLAQYILKAGLSQTSLRQLAQAAGVSDRMLLYYFENKSDILTAVLMRIASDLAEQLNTSIPENAALSPAELLEKGAKLTNSPDMQPYMHVSIEIAAAAGRGEEPYASVAKAMIAGFLDWIEKRLNTEDTEKRKIQAAMILAVIDGLSILSLGIGTSETQKVLGEVVTVIGG